MRRRSGDGPTETGSACSAAAYSYVGLYGQPMILTWGAGMGPAAGMNFETVGDETAGAPKIVSAAQGVPYSQHTGNLPGRFAKAGIARPWQRCPVNDEPGTFRNGRGESGDPAWPWPPGYGKRAGPSFNAWRGGMDTGVIRLSRSRGPGRSGTDQGAWCESLDGLAETLAARGGGLRAAFGHPVAGSRRWNCWTVLLIAVDGPGVATAPVTPIRPRWCAPPSPATPGCPRTSWPTPSCCGMRLIGARKSTARMGGAGHRLLPPEPGGGR